MTLSELINDSKKILENGINIISICDNINFQSASSGGHFQIINVFADFDREVLPNGDRLFRRKGYDVGQPLNEIRGETAPAAEPKNPFQK